VTNHHRLTMDASAADLYHPSPATRQLFIDRN